MPADPTDTILVHVAWHHAEKNPDGTQHCNHIADHKYGECGRETGDWEPLYRVVAGRPDQPTPLFEGTVDDLWAKVDRACSFDHPDPDRDPDWWLDRRVTVYATDPHTPNQENPTDA